MHIGYRADASVVNFASLDKATSQSCSAGNRSASAVGFRATASEGSQSTR